jgi:hypothetical protein
MLISTCLAAVRGWVALCFAVTLTGALLTMTLIWPSSRVAALRGGWWQERASLTSVKLARLCCKETTPRHSAIVLQCYGMYCLCLPVPFTFASNYVG